MSQNSKTCHQCGLCCQLFYINLNEVEYFSGKYQTVFSDIKVFTEFTEAETCGAHILKQKADGSCIYLGKGRCTIHKTRPDVCRHFFCNGTEPEFGKMREIIEANRQ